MQEVREYSVTWEMDISAYSDVDAAHRALAIMRDPENIATCFRVAPVGTTPMSAYQGRMIDTEDYYEDNNGEYRLSGPSREEMLATIAEMQEGDDKELIK